MLIPVPDEFMTQTFGINLALTKALTELFGKRGGRWDLVAYFVPSQTYEIDIPDVADAAWFNRLFPEFHKGILRSPF